MPRVGVGLLFAVLSAIACTSQTDAGEPSVDAGTGGSTATDDGSGTWTWKDVSHTADLRVVCQSDATGTKYTVAATQREPQSIVSALFVGAMPPASGAYACVTESQSVGAGQVNVHVSIKTTTGAYQSADCESGTVTVSDDGTWTATDLPMQYDPTTPAGTLSATVRCPP